MTARCLIIDQSTMVRRVAARIIRELGFDVVEARTAQDALAICDADMPRVIMLDWKAQGMDGADFIAALRKLSTESGTPMPAVLFCTAERSVDQIVAALRAGADEYIMKPFDSDVIESKFALAGLLQGDRKPCAAH